MIAEVKCTPEPEAHQAASREFTGIKQGARMTFLKLWLEGAVSETEIGRFVEDWHEGRAGTGLDLHDYLGLSWDEYQRWATTPSALPLILATHV